MATAKIWFFATMRVFGGFASKVFTYHNSDILIDKKHGYYDFCHYLGTSPLSGTFEDIASKVPTSALIMTF